MSWFDLGAFVIVGLALVDGVWAGFLFALLETALVVAAAAAAHSLAPAVEPYLVKLVDVAPEDLPGAAHLATLATLLVLVAGVLVLLRPASRRWRFAHDRWLGGAVGAVNGLLLALLLFSVAMWSSPRVGGESTLAESRLLSVLSGAMHSGLHGLFPSHADARVEELRGT